MPNWIPSLYPGGRARLIPRRTAFNASRRSTGSAPRYSVTVDAGMGRPTLTVLTGKPQSQRRARNRLPDARNKTLRSRRVRRVFVAKPLEHHPLLRADTKREEDGERDQVHRTRHPVRDDEGLPDGIEKQRRVHRVADPAIDALRDESMLLPYLQSNRPIRTEISVRPMEQPEADHQADHAGNERAG